MISLSKLFDCFCCPLASSVAVVAQQMGNGGVGGGLRKNPTQKPERSLCENHVMTKNVEASS